MAHRVVKLNETKLFIRWQRRPFGFFFQLAQRVHAALGPDAEHERPRPPIRGVRLRLGDE